MKPLNLEQQLDVEAIQYVMATRAGRRFANNLLRQCGVYQSTFNSDQAVMSFQEGARNIGLMFLTFITKHAPEGYQLMIKEAQNDG